MPQLAPVIEALIRRSLPGAVHGRFDTAELFLKLPTLLEDGFLDLLLAHYVDLVERLRVGRDNPSTVRIVHSFAPVTEGDVLSEELLAIARRQLPAAAPEGGPPSGGGSAFKPRLPEPGQFAGPKLGASKVVALRQICQWLDGCKTNVALVALPESQQVAWISSFLKEDAATWWSGFRQGHPNPTFDDLKTGLVNRFVGPNPFELLCADLEGKTLKDFSKFDSFKAWFVQTVTAMRAFAPAGRMWSDNVLIDRLLLCLRDTLYYEGVVVDPRTRARPDTVAAALALMDERHLILVMRGQVQECAKATPKAAIVPAPSGKKPAAKRQGGASGTGPSDKDKGKKRARLPHVDYLMEVHPHLGRGQVQRHFEELKKPGAHLVCPLCKEEHYITKCPIHARRVSKGKFPAVN